MEGTRDDKEPEDLMKGREMGIRHLMSINLLKRMESSVHSFLLTIKRIYNYLYDTSQVIQALIDGKDIVILDEFRDLSGSESDFDGDDQNTDFFTVGKNIKIERAGRRYF